MIYFLGPYCPYWTLTHPFYLMAWLHLDVSNPLSLWHIWPRKVHRSVVFGGDTEDLKDLRVSQGSLEPKYRCVDWVRNFPEYQFTTTP